MQKKFEKTYISLTNGKASVLTLAVDCIGD